MKLCRPWLLLVVTGCVHIPPVKAGGDRGTDSGGSGSGSGSDVVCAAALAMPDLVTYLPMNEATGAAAADATAHHVDGTITGATWTTGRVGHGLAFNGVVDGVALADDALDNLPAISVCAWVRPNRATLDSFTIADKTVDGYANGWNAYIDNVASGQPLGFYTNHQAFRYGSSNVAPGTWTHLCTTWDGTEGVTGIQLYIDGRGDLVALDSGGGMIHGDDAAQPVMLGRSNQNQFRLDGSLDEVMIFKRAITPVEVAAIYACAP
ncbi:MAG: LamG domain-containing protein [Proteobacteria bacterium]|nr:LamG domain-containing protein [Pseudomonadota bacterium]